MEKKFTDDSQCLVDDHLQVFWITSAYPFRITFSLNLLLSTIRISFCFDTSFGYLPNIVSKAFLDLFFPVKTQVKFEEKTRQEIFKEEKTNGRLTVNWRIIL